MNTHQLIGLVAAEIIKQSLEKREENDTAVARFLLSRLARAQVAEIVSSQFSGAVEPEAKIDRHGRLQVC